MRLLVAVVILSGSFSVAADRCPVTQPPSPPFVPPAPYSPADSDGFLYGTPDLWVRLFEHPMPLREKIFWWRPGFDGAKEQRPNLTITIRPLNSGVTTVVDRPATNAYFGGEWSILTMIDFPTDGCWEVKGTYAGHTVSFITRVRRDF